MRTKKILAWMMAIAITSITLTACSHDKEVENSSKTSLRACGLSPSGTHSSSILFTDDDIEWFDVNTREIKFKDMSAKIVCSWLAVLSAYGIAASLKILCDAMEIKNLQILTGNIIYTTAIRSSTLIRKQL